MAQYKGPRQWTAKVMDAMSEGLLNPRDVADMCLNWLSEDDVREIVERNDLEETLKHV